MGFLIFYSFTRVIAFLGSLATMTVLIALDHPYWAIYPAALAAVTGLSVCFGGSDDTEDPQSS
jgi:hypothetical protein